MFALPRRYLKTVTIFPLKAVGHSSSQWWEFWLCRVWLPFGLFVQLTGFFWFPDTHRYKVNVVNCLLLAALFSLFNRKLWHDLLRSTVLLPAFVYLLYMSALPIIRGNKDPFACLQWSFYVALYLIAVSCRLQLSLQNWRRLLWVSTFVCAVAIAYGLSHEIFVMKLWSPSYRFTGSGTLYNPLRSGHVFGFFYSIALWLSLAAESRRYRVSSAVLATICLLGIIMTGSRAPLLAAAISSVFIMFFTAHSRLRGWYLLAGTLIVASVAFFYGDRLIERGWSLRPEIWSQAIELWRHNPWFGAGHNAKLEILVANVDDIFYDTHNIVLAVLFYGGVVGVLLFCALHVNAFYRAFAARNTSVEAILACALMVYGMLTLQFDGGIIITRPNESWLLLWFPIAFWLNIRSHYLNDDTTSERTMVTPS